VIEINQSRFRSPRPFKHQLEGVRALVRHKAFFLGDAPRTCKSRQVVDAACVLFDAGEIDLVLVVCPVAARIVWGDKKLGQVRLYSWVKNRVHEFHARPRDLWEDETDQSKSLYADQKDRLQWVVTNYDFIRSEKNLRLLVERLAAYQRPMLVLDESSAIGNQASLQSKAIASLRKLCLRVVMLNGTPGDPPKLWSQFNILDDVLSRRYKTFTSFRWRYATWDKTGTMRPVKGKNGQKGGMKLVHTQVGWKDLDKLSRILSPYCLRRERKDCPELRNIPISYDLKEVALDRATWKWYQQLKREAIIELSKTEVYMSTNAGVRLMRLAQLTSGHLGGFEDPENAVRDLSSEKLEFTLELLCNSTATNFIVWCRWTRERERLSRLLAADGFVVYQLYGGQRRDERREAEMIFADGGAHLEQDGRRRVMVAQPAAGGIALDMSAASEVYRLSNDYSLKTLEQSDDRPLGPAQKADVVLYTDVLATGPDGQRTIDHIVVTALREKRSLARMTVSEWRKELEDE